ncbi:MAG: phosphate ABC transporter, permease protein PstA, partial [Gammaproteobacteria bacterium]|nr:phosphate ABC transporter, permease protein PstA [Gammaproteobacteria bacterium]
MKQWINSGSPMIWLNAGAVSASIIMVVALLGLIAYQGLGHFWPKTVISYQYSETSSAPAKRLIGEIHGDEWVPKEQMQQNMPGLKIEGDVVERLLIKTGNRDSGGLDFRWIVSSLIESQQTPESLMVLERHEWGNFYGFLKEIKEGDKLIVSD